MSKKAVLQKQLDMPTNGVIAVPPFKNAAQGEILLPGSKSITARALLLAALSKGKTRLQRPLWSEDTKAMIEGLKRLGFRIRENKIKKWIEIWGEEGNIPKKNSKINIKQAGTAGRFLPALAALSENGVYEFSSAPSFEDRPMAPLLDILQTLGAHIVYKKKKGHYPFILYSNRLKGGTVELKQDESSQFLSALLLVSNYAQQALRIKGQEKLSAFVEMTQAMRKNFGYKGSKFMKKKEHWMIVNTPKAYEGPIKSSYEIEVDATAASYWAALVTILGGKLKIKGLQKVQLQGDKNFLDCLKPHGLEVLEQKRAILLKSQGLRYSEKEKTLNFKYICDTFITFAAISPLLGKHFKLEGLEHSHLQESDRPKATAKALRMIGQFAQARKGSLEIVAKQVKESVAIDPFGDHRLAMAFGILGTYPFNTKDPEKPWLWIKNPECCKKTYPNFFKELKRLSKVTK